MNDDSIDYSIHYKKFNDGSISNLKQRSEIYSKLFNQHLNKFPSSSKILDYGCGDGALLHYLKNKFNNIIGIDDSKEQIISAKKKQSASSISKFRKFR